MRWGCGRYQKLLGGRTNLVFSQFSCILPWFVTSLPHPHDIMVSYMCLDSRYKWPVSQQGAEQLALKTSVKDDLKHQFVQFTNDWGGLMQNSLLGLTFRWRSWAAPSFVDDLGDLKMFRLEPMCSLSSHAAEHYGKHVCLCKFCITWLSALCHILKLQPKRSQHVSASP